MPRLDYKHCKKCGGHVDEVGTLSHARLCRTCGHENLERNVDGLVAHAGPEFTRWRRAIAASVGAYLLDDLSARP